MSDRKHADDDADRRGDKRTRLYDANGLSKRVRVEAASMRYPMHDHYGEGSAPYRDGLGGNATVGYAGPTSGFTIPRVGPVQVEAGDPNLADDNDNGRMVHALPIKDRGTPEDNKWTGQKNQLLFVVSGKDKALAENGMYQTETLHSLMYELNKNETLAKLGFKHNDFHTVRLSRMADLFPFYGTMQTTDTSATHQYGIDDAATGDDSGKVTNNVLFGDTVTTNLWCFDERSYQEGALCCLSFQLGRLSGESEAEAGTRIIVEPFCVIDPCDATTQKAPHGTHPDMLPYVLIVGKVLKPSAKVLIPKSEIMAMINKNPRSAPNRSAIMAAISSLPDMHICLRAGKSESFPWGPVPNYLINSKHRKEAQEPELADGVLLGADVKSVRHPTVNRFQPPPAPAPVHGGTSGGMAAAAAHGGGGGSSAPPVPSPGARMDRKYGADAKEGPLPVGPGSLPSGVMRRNAGPMHAAASAHVPAPSSGEAAASTAPAANKSKARPPAAPRVVTNRLDI